MAGSAAPGLRDEARPLALGLALNMFCQYIQLWMYVTPAADLYRWRPPSRTVQTSQ